MVILQEEEDDTTREWLVNVMSNQRMGSVISSRASRRFSAFDRPRKSIMNAISRLSSAQLPLLDDQVSSIVEHDKKPQTIESMAVLCVIHVCRLIIIPMQWHSAASPLQFLTKKLLLESHALHRSYVAQTYEVSLESLFSIQICT